MHFFEIVSQEKSIENAKKRLCAYLLDLFYLNSNTGASSPIVWTVLKVVAGTMPGCVLWKIQTRRHRAYNVACVKSYTRYRALFVAFWKSNTSASCLLCYLCLSLYQAPCRVVVS